MNDLSEGGEIREVKIMCAWCKRGMGEKDGEGVEGISHSMCEECFGRLEKKAENWSGLERGVNTQEKKRQAGIVTPSKTQMDV